MKESKNKLCPKADVCKVSHCIHRHMHGFCNTTFPCHDAPGTYEYEVELKIGTKIIKRKERTAQLIRCKKYNKLQAKILSL